METPASSIKYRDILFRGPYAAHLKPEAAMLLLVDVTGVEKVALANQHTISIMYDLRLISMMQIETALSESGFHLDNSLMSKIRRALYYYSEDTERRNHGLEKLSCSNGCAAKIFASSYKNRKHGCRDHRPDHLRKYL